MAYAARRLSATRIADKSKKSPDAINRALLRRVSARSAQQVTTAEQSRRHRRLNAAGRKVRRRGGHSAMIADFPILKKCYGSIRFHHAARRQSRAAQAPDSQG